MHVLRSQTDTHTYEAAIIFSLLMMSPSPRHYDTGAVTV